MKRRDAEKCKRQPEQAKVANHLHNSEHRSEDIANLPWMPKVCDSLLFNRSLCIGLELAIVVRSLQLGSLSIFR